MARRPLRERIQQGFIPTSLPGCQLWLAADHATLVREAGMAAQFTAATSEYLSVAHNASLFTGDIDFMVAAWVYVDDTGSTRIIASKWNSVVDNNGEWDIYRTSGDRFGFSIYSGVTGNSVTATSFGAVSSGTWYFVVGWHDSVANTVNIQVNNGTADSAATTITPSATSTAAFRLGAENSTPTYFWNGRVQCVGFWKSILTAAQRTTLYNSGTPLAYDQLDPDVKDAASLQAYWELNEPSGTRRDAYSTNDLTDNNTVTTNPGTCLNAVGTWSDLSGQGNNVTQSTQANKPVIRMPSGGVTAFVKKFIRFDGTNDQLASSAFASALSQPYTVFLVGRMAVTNANQTLLDGVANTNVVGITSTPAYTTNLGSALTGGTPNTSAHIVSLVADGTDTLFVDGVSTVSGDSGANALDGVRLGATVAGANFLNGDIAEVIVYDRALNSMERTRVERYLANRYGIAVT